jgi:hypothetical protein
MPHFNHKSAAGSWRGVFMVSLYTIWVLGISAGLLFCNSMTSFVIYSGIPQSLTESLPASVSQLYFFLMPVALTFVEWYLFDQLRRMLSP